MRKDDVIILDEKASPNQGSIQETGTMVENQDGSKTIRLNHPFEVTFQMKGGAEKKELIETLTLRRPNGGDIREMQKFTDQFKQATIAFSRLCGQPEAVFDKLDIDDVGLVSEVIESFLSKSPKTGKS